MFATKLIVILVLAALSASAFRLSGVNSRRSLAPLRMSETEEGQTVTDLNLEEMQDMFEAADKADPTPAPKAAAATGSMNFADEPGISLFPKGLWDPAGLSTDVSDAQFRLFQEAETKHGRVCMLAFLGLWAGETFENDIVNGQAIYQFQQIDAQYPFWIWATTFVAMIEVGYILKNWQPLELTGQDPSGLAKLRPEVIPGDFGWDPLNLRPKDPEKYKVMKTKELNNGRLAMLAVAGIVGQELATGLKIF